MRKFCWTALVAVLNLVVMSARPADAGAPAEPIRVYIFAGQSNMTGAATMAAELPTVAPTLQVPRTNVRFWGPTTDVPRRWATLEPPTEMRQNIFQQGFGPELSAARALSDLHPASQIAIVKYAWNATDLHWAWDPSHTYGLYAKMLFGVRTALKSLAAETHAPVIVSGFFWMQGESDTDTAYHANSYGKNLRNFIASVRSDLHAPRLPFVIGQISDVKKYRPVLCHFSPVVRAQEAQVARDDPYAFLVSTDGLEHSAVSPIHYSTRGTIDLGRRFVRARFGL